MPSVLTRAQILVVILSVWLTPAWAQTTESQAPAPSLSAEQTKLQSALSLFATRSYAKVIDGINAVAESGAAHAGDILTALSRRRAYVDKTGTIGAFRADKTYFDLVTHQQLDARPSGLKSVRVNNRVRNAVKAALATLRLRSPEPALRIEAANELLRAKDRAALPVLDKLIDKEADPAAKQAMVETRAALVLLDQRRSQEAKLAAVAVLRSRGDQTAIAALQPALGSSDPAVHKAGAEAVETIEAHLRTISRIQDVWYGLSLGSVLLLAAIGLAITFGVMGVINMAHGEMVMLGAYTTFVVQELFRAYAPDAFDWSLVLAVPAAFAVAGLVGIAIERGIIRYLYGRPLETLLATWGVSLILQQTVRRLFGPSNREVGAPSYMSGGFDLFGLVITYNRLWIIVFTLVVFAGLLAVLRLTRLGLEMRAVTQNRSMAASMGIRTGYVDAMTFGLGSGVAGIAGVALSQIDNVSPNLGQNYIIDSFMVVVFGGVGNLWGTLVSAFALGITNKLLEPWAGAVLAKILILVLLILFIQKRPRGLFALKGRAIEA